tara:strand:+ start:10964 stop:11260 length:297 start_codon:yes stop_codon:yes gene_type:complete
MYWQLEGQTLPTKPTKNMKKVKLTGETITFNAVINILIDHGVQYASHKMEEIVKNLRPYWKNDRIEIAHVMGEIKKPQSTELDDMNSMLSGKWTIDVG